VRNQTRTGCAACLAHARTRPCRAPSNGVLACACQRAARSGGTRPYSDFFSAFIQVIGTLISSTCVCCVCVCIHTHGTNAILRRLPRARGGGRDGNRVGRELRVHGVDSPQIVDAPAPQCCHAPKRPGRPHVARPRAKRPRDSESAPRKETRPGPHLPRWQDGARPSHICTGTAGSG
jgi:hypothetical protein